MKKQVLSALALCTCLGVAQAQTDVTGEYLVNPSFESSVITYDKAATGNVSCNPGDADQAPAVDYSASNWAITQHEGWGISATVEYGTAKTLNNRSVPTQGPNASSGSIALSAMSAWGGSRIYQQNLTTELPAGIYKLQCPTYNANTSGQKANSALGFIAGEKSYTSKKVSFASDQWTTDEITFYLPENVTGGKIQIGLTAPNETSNNIAHLILDDVSLYKLENPTPENPIDFTNNVGTAQASWAGAGGAITVGGIPVVEKYSKDYYTGNVFSQTISNLPAGVYRAELYANASAAIHNDGGNVWERKMIVDEGDNTCTIASINGVKIGLPIHERTSVSSPDIITFNGIEVTEDGTLTISIDNDKEGANWIFAQIKSLVYQGADASAALKTEVTALINEAKAYVDNCPEGIATTVNVAISQGETAVSGSDINTLNAAIETLNNAIELAKAAVTAADELEALISECQTTATHSYAQTTVLSTFQTDITTAESQLAAATTLEAIHTATATLETARQAYIFNARPETGYPFDYDFLVAEVGNSTNGWANQFSAEYTHPQNYQYKNSNNKDTETLKKTGYIEAWNNNVDFSGTLTYTLNDLPNGHYKISAYAFTTVGGTTSFTANDQSVALDNTTNKYTNPVIEDVTVTDGTLTFGLNITNAGWIGITNIQLQYLSALETEVSLNITAGWATLILPFEAAVPENVKAYTCGAVGEVQDGVATLTLTEADKLEANTPYILEGVEGTYSFKGLNTATENAYTKGLLTGTLVDMTAQEGTYVLQNQTNGVGFYKVGSDAASQPTIGANRVYLNADAVAGGNVQAFILKGIDGDGTTTGIDGTMAEADATVNVYNLNGILVRQNVKMSEALDGLQKGIYIVNGTKKAVK